MLRTGISIDPQGLKAFSSLFGEDVQFIRHLQITGVLEAGTDPDDIHRNLTAVRELCPGLTVSFHAYPGMNLVEETPRVQQVWLDLAKELICFAKDCGGIFVNFHAGYGIDANSWVRRQKYRETLVPVIRELLGTAKPLGLEIHLENLYPLPRHSDFCYVGDRLSDFNYVFSHIDDPQLKVCYDYGHGNLDEYGIEILRQLADRLGSVHIHDNDQVIDVHAAMGQYGATTIHWEEELSFLKEMRFSGPFILEGQLDEQRASLDYLKGIGAISTNY